MSVEFPNTLTNPATADSADPTLSSSIMHPDSNEEANEKHLRTQHLLSNLKGRTISGGFITMSAQAAKFAISLGSTVVLARLLTPRDFGLVALVTTITGFLAVFRHAGLAIPTVQRENITDAQVSNLFWINLGVSGLCTLIVAALAPALAMFYRDSRLTAITLCLSTTFLIGGFRVQHLALLRRQLRFKAIAVIEIGSMALGVAVGIAMAVMRFGPWSLVGMTLATELGSFVLTGSLSPWRPSWPSRQSGVRPLLAFGAHQTAASLVFSIARGCDTLLIGRFYGAVALGLYTRGASLVIRPLEQFLLPINAVFFPVLSRLQSQPARYRSIFLRLYEVVALTTFFVTSLMLALSHPLVLVLLGPKWEKTTAIFAGFTFTALQLPLSNVSNWLLTSQGRGKDIFCLNAIGGALSLLSFIAGLPFGPLGVAIAFSASGLLLRLPIAYFIMGRHGPVTTRDLWAGFFRHLHLWVVMYAATFLTRSIVAGQSAVVQLLICLPVGVLVGLSVIFAFKTQRRVAVRLLESVYGIIKNFRRRDASQ